MATQRGTLHFVCYRGADGTRLFWTGNEMAGGRINGFELLADHESFVETDFIDAPPQIRSEPSCDPTPKVSRKQRVGELRLGDPISKAAGVYGTPSSTSAGRFVYFREAPPSGEAKGTRTEVLTLRFKNGRVVAISGLTVSSS